MAPERSEKERNLKPIKATWPSNSVIRGGDNDTNHDMLCARLIVCAKRAYEGYINTHMGPTRSQIVMKWAEGSQEDTSANAFLKADKHFIKS